MEKLRQAADRVVGELRIGGVALPALHDERGGIAAAAADLDLVAELARAGRLADERGGEALAASGRPFEQLRVPLTASPSSSPVTRNESRPPKSAAAPRDEAERRGHHRGEPALHVDRAAAVEHAVDDLRGEGRMPPARLRSGRHDVDMAGERQMRARPRRSRRRDSRPARSPPPRRPAARREAGRREMALEDVERRPRGRRDARRAHQFGQQLACVRGSVMPARLSATRRRRSGPLARAGSRPRS